MGSRLSQFAAQQLARPLRASMMVLASIVGVWVIWLFLMLIGLAFRLFIAVGNGDRPMPDNTLPNTPLSHMIDDIISGVPVVYMLVGLFLVCMINLLYLCRYWDHLPVKIKVLSGLLFSVTSLPFLLIVYGLSVQFLTRT